MMTRVLIATLVLATLTLSAAHAQSRNSRDPQRQWRAETPYWEILRRQRERAAIMEEMTPPAESEAKKRDAEPAAEPADVPVPVRREAYI